VAVTAALRAALPKGRYILSTASWHVGMYGEGAFAAAKPLSIYTGVNLAMAKSAAGQQLDLINVMAYDAGSLTSTGFDPLESFRAHKAVWGSSAIAIGVEVPPEAWGGNVVTLEQVTNIATYVRANGGAGMMLWSLHKKSGAPGPQAITQQVCTTYAMGGCSAALPM
jgi:chitinase